MGYNLYAFIAKRGTFDSYKPLSQKVVVAELEQGFDMMLNDWHLYKALQLPDEPDPEGFEKLLLSPALMKIMEKLSLSTPVAYILVDFFGGGGEQHAIVWKEGQIALIPENNGFFAYIPYYEGPVNVALRAIGVQAEKSDEFITIGFYEHRHMHEWFTACTGLTISAYYPDEG